MTLLTYALALLAIVGLAGTARLAQEHHALRAAQIIALLIVSWGHGKRSRPISRPHPLRQRNPGRHIAGRDTPRPAPAQADTTREAVAT